MRNLLEASVKNYYGVLSIALIARAQLIANAQVQRKSSAEAREVSAQATFEPKTDSSTAA